MTSRLCVDASVAVKWVVAEPDSDLASCLYTRTMSTGGSLIAPMHLAFEVPSAIYKRVQASALTAERAKAMVDTFSTLRLELAAPRELPSRALTIAANHHLKWIYDAYYVALAEIAGCEMWTADAALHERLRDAFPRVRLLRDYEPSRD